MRHVRISVAALVCSTVALTGSPVVHACTAFCAVGGGQVLVGNNEDWNNPRSKLWFVAAKPGSYGRMYTGFDDLVIQGGMNEHGLWFDAFAAPAVSATQPSELPPFPGNIVDTAMAECRTVEEVVSLFSRYDRPFLREAIYMFADASGDAVSIERNAIVRKTRSHFVQTNFHQSRGLTGRGDDRFLTASTMLEQAGDNVSIDLFRRTLAATYQKGGYTTLYSNIYDLKSRTMYLYYFHDFERAVTFRLADELKKGERVLDIPALFPQNAAAEAFAARRQAESRGPGRVATVAMFAVLGTFIGLAVFGWIRAGRRFRIGLVAVAGAVGLVVLATVVTLSMHRKASTSWMEFSIGPASGNSASVNATTLRADGMTLKGALATAYGIPAVRVLGPAWLTDTRYSIRAVVGLDEAESFRPLLQEELKGRLGLETHVELRPFDVFVLSAAGAPRLERTRGDNASIRITRQDANLRQASMTDLASALQSILGKPVIDETGITGSYNLEFAWGSDRVPSVTATLQDRFGLRLSPASRDLEALIVDGIRSDPSLALLAQIGRITRPAPAYVRERIADVMTIR